MGQNTQVEITANSTMLWTINSVGTVLMESPMRSHRDRGNEIDAMKMSCP